MPNQYTVNPLWVKKPKQEPKIHSWKRPASEKFRSIPCEHLKDQLRTKNINFIEEWKPLETRKFSIDIAFPDIKLGIEINGNQHYHRDGSLREYYQNRHDLIVQAGWTLIELPYVACYHTSVIETVLSVKSQPDYSQFFQQQQDCQDRKRKRTPEETFANKSKGQKEMQRLKWEPFKRLILESGINFEKFGWVQQVSVILNIRPQKVNQWMIKRMPELYEICFKRRQTQVIGSTL